jgi:acyl-CoA thioesterase-1
MLKKYIPIWLMLLLIWACSSESEKKNAVKENTAAASGQAKKKEEQMKTIVFFGTSLTAGYGLDPSQSYPALIQNKIDSLGLDYKVVNAGLSGETTSGGNNRIDWVLRQPVDVFVLELGANDGLRGIDPRESRKNLQSIIDKVKAKYPEAEIVMVGMEIPPSMGGAYGAQFRVIFRELAEKNELHLVPFLLKGVGGERLLNQADGIHPNAAGQKILAENVWGVLKDVILAQGGSAATGS